MEEVTSAASLTHSGPSFESANAGLLARHKVRVSPRVWSVFALLLCAGVLAWHARRYLPFMADDAFISLRYSQRWVEGKGLTWDSSEPVEGYSNLTWVVACAALGALGVDWVLAARIVGAASSFALLAAIAYAFRPGRGAGFWCATAAMLSIAVCTPVAIWAQGGLEQPLVAALLAWVFALTLYRGEPAHVNLRPPALLLGLLTLSRPDGVFLAALFSVGVGVSRGLHRAQLRRGAVLFTGAAIALGLQLAFRWFYYHDWVPNPARIKVAFTQERLKAGLEYLNQALLFLSPIGLALLAAVTALTRRAEARIRCLPIGLLASSWAAYVAFIGGDIFPGRRHVVVLIVAGSFALGELLYWMKRELSGRAPVFGVSLAFVVVQAIIQTNDPEAKAAQEERWEWDGEVVGRLLNRAFARQAPLLAVDPAGAVPFFSELPAIDMLGLNDRYIAHHPPADLGKGWLAHEFGNGKYVLERRPDLVLFCLPGGRDKPCFRGGLEMQEDPSFAADYRLVTFEGASPYSFQSRIWVRMESPKIGVRRSESQIVVPGFLFAQGAGTIARLNDEQQLAALITSNGMGWVERLELPTGTYCLRAHSSESVTLSASNGVVDRAPGCLKLQLPAPTVLDVEVRPHAGGKDVWLQQVDVIRENTP